MTALAQAGVFDTIHFSRLEPGFVLQTSVAQDRLVPLTNQQNGMLHPLPGEFSQVLKHSRGVLSMGRNDGQPDSAESSFSILLGDAPHLDGQYTIFGHVEFGMDVVDRLVQTRREPDSNQPSFRLTILHAQVIHQDDLSTLSLVRPREMKQMEALEFPSPALAARSMTILQQHCWRCHGGASVKADLDLTNATRFFQGGKHGTLFNKKDLSASLLLQRLHAQDDQRMPPDAPLHSEESKTIAQWLEQGAEFPPAHLLRKVRQTGLTTATNHSTHWSFNPIAKVATPTIKQEGWCANDIDRFILEKLEAKQLVPTRPASPEQLRRRIAYDLTGLPPDAKTKSDTPYAKQVDELLGSPHYGEQMARFWLDLVRYADSDGYEDDKNRPLAYTYRDFVIRAFNRDLPFDQFLRWQIAGDEIEPLCPEAIAATGFLAAGPYQTFAPRKKDRLDELDDIVTTIGVSFMGMTTGCARCHDHKHDPITQHDYYRLVSVFNGSTRKETYLDARAGEQFQSLRLPADTLKKELEILSTPAKEKALDTKIRGLPITPAEMDALRLPVDPNNDVQAGLLRRYSLLLQFGADEIRAERAENISEQWDRLEQQIGKEEGRLPSAPQQGLVYSGSQVRPCRFLDRGDPDREREDVPVGFITSLTRGRPVWKDDTWRSWGDTPRKAFAYWLTDTEAGAGQLAARVIVNRIWQMHFGFGLVRTSNDFGLHGDKPTHPELLDWLANDFIQSGWKIKRLHRLIMMSSTYQLGASAEAELIRHDPENRLFGRRVPQRLSADSLRDSILAVTSSLNRELYGSGIMPAIPREAIFPTAPKHGIVWPDNAAESPENWRRSIYIFAKRSNPVPLLQLFDAPEGSASCARRSQSTVPTQALALLNDRFVRNQASILATNLLDRSESNYLKAADGAYRAVLGRSCTSQELQWLTTFFSITANESSNTKPVERLTDVCHVLMMTNEFIYVN